MCSKVIFSPKSRACLPILASTTLILSLRFGQSVSNRIVRPFELSTSALLSKLGEGPRSELTWQAEEPQNFQVEVENIPIKESEHVLDAFIVKKIPEILELRKQLPDPLYCFDDSVESLIPFTSPHKKKPYRTPYECQNIGFDLDENLDYASIAL